MRVVVDTNVLISAQNFGMCMRLIMNEPEIANNSTSG